MSREAIEWVTVVALCALSPLPEYLTFGSFEVMPAWPYGFVGIAIMIASKFAFARLWAWRDGP